MSFDHMLFVFHGTSFMLRQPSPSPPANSMSHSLRWDGKELLLLGHHLVFSRLTLSEAPGPSGFPSVRALCFLNSMVNLRFNF